MALTPIQAIAVAKGYTDETVIGGGAIKGKNCVVDSIVDITNGHRVNFKWTLDDGTEKTGYMDVADGEDGLGIKSVDINDLNHLIVTYDDDTTEDAGEIDVAVPIDDTEAASNKVYSSSKVAEDYAVTKDSYADEVVITSDAYNISDGAIVTTSTWCRTKGYVPKDIKIAVKDSAYVGWMTVQAFNVRTGDYIGRWNGSTFSTSAVSNGRVLFFDWNIWHNQFPNYAFALNFQNTSVSAISPSDVYSGIDIARTETEGNYLVNQTVKDVNNLVDYMASGGFNFSQQFSEGRINCGCANNKFFIYGLEAKASFSRVMRLTGSLSLDANATGYSTGITLKANRKYLFTLQTTKGARKDANNNEIAAVVSVYAIGQSSSLGTYEQTAKTFKRYVEVDSDTVVNVCIYIHGNNTYNCEGYVTMEDITGDNVLSYYQNELVETISKVRSVNDEPALVFPWVTDIHRYKSSIPQTFSKMVENIKALCNQIKCDILVNTGDTIEGDKQKNTSLGQAYTSIADFKNIGLPFFYTEGNHDNNSYISSGALVFTLKEVYGGFFTATKDVTCNVNENGTDYYFDFEKLGVRFISLNSCNVTKATNYGFGDSTAAWLEDALDTQHIVLLASHISPIKEHVWDNINPDNANDIRTALASFVSNGGTLLLLTGHSHIDAEFVSPYVEVSNVCQKFEKADISTTQYQKISGMIDGIRNPDRTQGDSTEDAWTVGILKPVSKEFDFIRFGAGVDRYIHFEPIGATTVTSRLANPTWNTSDDSVATVSNGTITAVGNGKCAVFAKDSVGNIEVWVVSVS